jgi:Flp pilus assembly protein TadB
VKHPGLSKKAVLLIFVSAAAALVLGLVVALLHLPKAVAYLVLIVFVSVIVALLVHDK